MEQKKQLPPLCRYCGKSISKRTRYVKVLREGDLPMENTIPVEFWREIRPEEVLHNREDCQRYTNGTVTSVSYTTRDHGGAGQRIVAGFHEWDGKSYQSRYFCNGRHAQEFGYLAARGGMATDDYHKAVDLQRAAAKREESDHG